MGNSKAIMVFRLKKVQLQILFFSFPLLLLVAFVPLATDAVTIYTETASSPIEIRVLHSMQLQEGGLVFIKDTIGLSTSPGEHVEPLQIFSIGFPSKYGSNVNYCFAYDTSNPDVRFDVVPDVGLGRVGFYGLDVIFPEQIDVSDGKLYNFTVVCVLSNLVSPLTESSFNLDFPMYPSLTQDASLCNVIVTLPQYANHTGSSLLERILDFNVTTVDSSQVLTHTKSPLDAFTYDPAWLEFTTDDTFHLVEVDEIRREVMLDEWGGLRISDLYRLTNLAEKEFSQIKIQLPQGSYGVFARDALGGLRVVSDDEKSTKYTNATVSFRTPLRKGETGKFTVNYWLPWRDYVNQGGEGDFNLMLTLFEGVDWRIRKLVVTINIPEGARFQSSSINVNSVKKDVFKETVTFILYEVTPFHDPSFSFSYSYFVFWSSFRPTIWVGTLVVILSVIAFVWRAPRPKVTPVAIPSEDLRNFVTSYDEKRRILSDLESLEQQARKGKIPRRRFRVRKRTLEGRLSVLSRNLAGLREKIRKAGPQYENLMRQIEISETMLEGAKSDVRRIRTRYRRGEISPSAYRKLLEEYRRRSDQAKTKIDGVLFRIREETR